jgi:hypothetical protein
MEAKSIRLVDDHVGSPPAKSETPLKTITGTPGDMAVCQNKNSQLFLKKRKIFSFIGYIIYPWQKSQFEMQKSSSRVNFLFLYICSLINVS